ncbi:MAG: hypothetical protein PHX04_02105 [Bacilli bacterium]|nr:hypothetical protein [Bacilli bacterium]
MYIKKHLHKRLWFSVISVVVITLGIIGSSYALFMDVKTDVNAQFLTVGDLQITYTLGDTITIESLDPMTDEDASELTDNIYTFTILNEGTVPYTYTISLINNEEYLDETLLNPSFIRYDFNGVGARTLSDAVDREIFKGNLAVGQEKTFTLRLWVGGPYITGMPNETLGSGIHLKIDVDGKAGIS